MYNTIKYYIYNTKKLCVFEKILQQKSNEESLLLNFLELTLKREFTNSCHVKIILYLTIFLNERRMCVIINGKVKRLFSHLKDQS